MKRNDNSTKSYRGEMLIRKVPPYAVLIQRETTGKSWARTVLDLTEGGPRQAAGPTCTLESDFQFGLSGPLKMLPNKNVLCMPTLAPATNAMGLRKC